MKYQFAGNIGFISVGVGKKIAKNFKYDILYGYTPKKYSENELHSFTLKYSYFPKQFKISKNMKSNIYTGVAINFSKSSNTFISTRGEVPDHYYGPTAIHYIPHIGIDFTKCKTKKSKKKRAFFMEVTTLDNYIRKMHDNDYKSIKEYLSYDFGSVFYF